MPRLVSSVRTGYSGQRGRARRWLLLLIFSWCAISAHPAGQQAATEWELGESALSRGDRRAILELAKRIGISDPRKVSGYAGDCAYLRIESHPIFEGRL